MMPSIPVQRSDKKGRRKNALLCAMSQKSTYLSGILNNFAVGVEPWTASFRPTLRDGH
jgi:hypothetical protein